MRSKPLIALAILATLAAGCGQHTSTEELEEAAGRRAEAQERRVLQARVPKDASPTLRALYAKFPLPQPDPNVEGSAAAIKTGERACAGSTPLEVKRRYYAQAEERLSPAQRTLIARLARYERASSRDPSFAAGQLAAGVYEASLTGEVARYGYQGCVYALAREQERRLEAAGGG